MRYRFLLLFLFVFSVSGCSKNVPDDPIDEKEKTDIEKIQEADWETTEVKEGITWKYHHFRDLFKSRQSVTLFEIDLNEDLEIDIPYVNSGFLKTSDAAIDARAAIGFNGSFFSTSVGGSTVFFKKEGEVITETRKNFTPYRENGAIVISEDGEVSIAERPSNGWTSLDAYTALASGPLLIMDGKALDQKDEAFNRNRHPRTAVGLTADNRLLVFVVDGRASEAHGMTIEEMTQLFQAFDCQLALNLDGGGSSTAWVRNRGVVNYPSDNKTFDHEGERGVATVLVVK